MPRLPDSYDEIDTGPLNKEQRRAFMRDMLQNVRELAQEMWEADRVAHDGYLIDRLQFQLVGPDDDD